MNQERLQALMDYLDKDEERAKALFIMKEEEALAEINADGNDFTIEEYKALLEGLKEAVKTNAPAGEIDADALDNVSGGLAVATCIMLYKVGVGVYAGACAIKAWGYSQGLLR